MYILDLNIMEKIPEIYDINVNNNKGKEESLLEITVGHWPFSDQY